MLNKILPFLLLVCLSLTQCSDPCDDVDCGANGTCVEGTCNCDPGYEGLSCETEIRAKYIGTYSGDVSACLEGFGQQIPPEFSTISINVTADPNSVNEVVVGSSNPLLSDQSITVDPEDGTFIIPTNSTTIDIEQIPLPITITVTGNGEWTDENTLIVTLDIIIPLLSTISCTITMTK